jgi:endoglucanase
MSHKTSAAKKLLSVAGGALRATSDAHAAGSSGRDDDDGRRRRDRNCRSGSGDGGGASCPAVSRQLPEEFDLFAHRMQADDWADTHARSQPAMAALMRQRICGRASALWLGDWGGAAGTAAREAAAAAVAGKLFCFVLYNIPDRDCGLYSKGGAGGAAQYLAWVRGIADAVGRTGARGIFVVEPDALAHTVAMSDGAARARKETLAKACRELRRKCPAAYIYLDVGHPRWHPPGCILGVLQDMAVWGDVDGLAINVSNSCTTQVCYEYGMRVTTGLRENVGFVIDTSRNGAGPPPATGEAQWANPPSLRLGTCGSTKYAREKRLSSRLHAVLWIKAPGESDGAVNGAPPAGHLWPTGVKRLLGDPSL